MKAKLLSGLILFAIYSATANTAGIDGKILDYGFVKLSDDQNSVSAPQTPSGVAHVYNSPIAISYTTNQIPAKLGVAFGVLYEISDPDAKDGDIVNVETVMSYPLMTKPDGSTSKGFSWSNKSAFKNHKAWAIVYYSLDHNYEVVSGLWRFEIQIGGKPLCSKEFTLFRE